MCPRPRSERPVPGSIVVVGAGHAGVQAADALRAAGHDGPLTVVGDEPALPYQRPPLSKEHLASTATAMPLRAERFFRENRIELRTGVTATAIDRASRTVHLDDGGALPYDVLVPRSTSRPRRPHLGFGSGTHLCAGHWAARISIGEIAVPLLYAQLPGLRTDPRRAEQWHGWVFRGLTTLPVTW